MSTPRPNGKAATIAALALGSVIVDLQKLRKRMADDAEQRRAWVENLKASQKAGKYELYSIVQVREVKVRAHVRAAHKRFLLRT